MQMHLTRLLGTPEPMHFWEGFGGVRIAGDSWGDPEGHLVILLHGGGQTRHSWGGTGETLGRAGYYAVAFDARGHGDSDWSKEGLYGQDLMVKDLQCVIAALGAGRPVLIGASMGGGTSLVAAGEHQVDANALILVDIAPRVEMDGVAKVQAFMAQSPEGFANLDEVADAIGRYQPQRIRSKNLESLAKNVRLGSDGRYHWHWDPLYMVGRRDLSRREKRLEICTRNLTLPTLLVRGAQSDVLSEEGAQEFLRLCPVCEYVNVANAGHMVAGDRNDIFGNAAISFLNRVVPVGGKPIYDPIQPETPVAPPPRDLNDLP